MFFKKDWQFLTRRKLKNELLERNLDGLLIGNKVPRLRKDLHSSKANEIVII